MTKKHEKPEPKAYTAPFDVFTAARYTKAGDVFVTDADPMEGWVELNAKQKAAQTAATEELPGDPSIDKLDLAALQALATSKKVNTAGIEKDRDALITAIHAAQEPTL